MTRSLSIAAGLIVLGMNQTAMADCPENAKRCGDDGMVQICMKVGGTGYWTTQDYKCAANGEVTDAPVVACTENNRRCGDDGYEQICLADGETFSWFRIKPHLSCR